MGGYWTRVEWLAVISRWAKLATSHRCMTCGRLYSYDTLLERLPQHFEHMAAELGQFIQQEDAVVRQRHLARHRDLTTPDQPHIRDGVVRGATGARRDPRQAVTGEAGDAMDARGLEGFGQRHGWQDSGKSPQHPGEYPTTTD
jgi:hypothetical protein